VEALLESRENPKRRRRSDDEYKNPTNHSLDTTTAKPTKSNTEPTCEYTKPVTTTIPLGDTPASSGGDEALLTVNETRTVQALDTIPVEPIKRTGEDADKFAEPITTAAPQGDNLGTTSLTAIEGETHNPQTQTGSTDEVCQSHRNPTSDKVPHSPTPGTSSKQHVEILMENLGNRKRKGGSNDELPHPSTLLLDTTIPRSAKRSRGFTVEYVKPTTTSSRNTVSLTTHEAGPTPGTSPKQQVEALTESLGSRERAGGSDCGLPHPATLLLDTTIPWPARRNGGFTGAYVEPRTPATRQDVAPACGGRNAASLTTDETGRGVLTGVSFSQVARDAHEFHPRSAETHDRDSLTDTPPRQPDTKNCIQVGRDTYDVTSQPGTSYTFNPGIDTRTFQEQRPQPVTNPVCDDYDSMVVIDSSGPPNNLTIESASPREFHRRKKPRTGQAGHAKAQAGARRRK